MNLARQTLLIIGVLVLLMVLALYITSENLATHSFRVLEQKAMTEDMKRVERSLQSDAAQLDKFTYDWATWDDCYTYIVQPNDEFVESNLLDETFTQLDLNLIAMLNNQRETVICRGLDPSGEETTENIAGVINQLRELPEIWALQKSGDVYHGWVATASGQAVLFAARPVLRSNGEGPANGVLIMGQLWNSQLNAHIQTRTALPIQRYSIGTDPAIPLTPAQLHQVHGSSQPFIHEIDETTIAAYFAVNSVDGKPLVLVELVQARDIYQQGRSTTRVYQILLGIYGIAFGAIAIFLLRQRVLTPIDRLCKEVRTIASTPGKHERVSTFGDDEIAELGHDINHMVESLHALRANAARQETEKAMLLDAMDVQVWYLKTPATFGMVNRACAEFFGRLAPEMENVAINQVWSAAAVTRTERLRQDVFTEGTAGTMECELQNGKGEWRSLAITFSPHLNAAAQTDYAVCSAVDITERKQAERALIESEGRLNMALRSSSVGTWSWDLDIEQITWDRYMEKIFGLAEGSFDGKFETFLELIHPEDRELVKSQAKTVLQDRGIIEYEYRITGPNGDERTIYTRGELHRDAATHTMRMYGVCLDITDRVLAEAALRQSEEKFRSLVEHLPDYLALLDADGYIRFGNRDPLPIADSRVLPARRLPEFAAPLHRAELEGAIQRVLQTRQRQTCEAVMHLNGQRYWWSIRLGHIRLEGDVTGIIAICTDITERKQAEDELRRLTRARVIISECSLALVHAQDERELLYEAARSLVRNGGYQFVWGGILEPGTPGIEALAIAGGDAKAIDCLCDPASDAATTGSPRRVVRGTAIQSLERHEPVIIGNLRDTAADCPEYPLAESYHLTTAIALPLAIETRLIGVLQLYTAHPDILNVNELKLLKELAGDLAYGIQSLRTRSEHRRAESALIDSESRYRTLAEFCPIGIWHVKPDGATVYANPAMLQILQVDRIDDLISARPQSFFPVESLDTLRECVPIMERGETALFEVDLITATGVRRQVVVTGAPLLGPDGKLDAFIASFVDVTEQRAAELQSQRLEEKLHHSQKMESIGRLAGGIAHDFNNLLAAIIGYTELLKMECTDHTLVEEFVMPISTAAEDATNLIRQLLTFSHKTRHQTEQVDMNRLIGEIIGLLSRTLDRRIKIIQDLQAPVSIVVGDAAMLRSALLNIGINAGDAITESGSLTFSTRLVDADTAVSNARNAELPDGTYLEITIADTGCGMPPDILAHIFEPFFTTKNQGKGTGLGLATVYGTVKSHNGALGAESVLGEGSTFRIYLPISSQHMPHTVHSQNVSAPINGTGHILLVDDENMVRNFCLRSLQNLGYSVITAENGRQALDIFSDAPDSFDLVILDMIMPEMNGRDTFLAMRHIAPDVCAVMLTGFSLGVRTEDLLADGFRAVIYKPITVHDLAREVAANIRTAKA